MTDRLTEIKARVARCRAEIERLHDISAFNGLTEQVKALSAERDRLRGLLKIAFSAWMRGPDGHIAQDDVNAISAALEERKS